MELNFKNTKVLLVDDDENYGFALKTLLGSKGLEIKSFTNPEEALGYLRSNDTDIILLDYYMPEMTGEEFLKRFREFNKETIVFLQTAFSEEKPELEMLETLNIQGYIDKNKDPNEIFLDGYICKEPVYRTTPFGREIADVLLAVNRAYNKSDYIPTIAWGRNSRFCQSLEVGDNIRVWGRLQSREYQKKVSDTDVIKKIAYEVSVSKMERVQEEQVSPIIEGNEQEVM